MATVSKIGRLSLMGGGGLPEAQQEAVADEPEVLIGLKISLAPELVRDPGSGSKLFVSIPQSCKTVRSFKNHLSTKILKTHVPFYFYNGDFRIPDEEDIRIFSLLSDPCLVAPVPYPKSALSLSCNASGLIASTSTPLPNAVALRGAMDSRITPPAKRVKFSDEYSLDVSGITNGLGLDNALLMELNEDETGTPTGDSSKKRKRHRRHKSKKSDFELRPRDLLEEKSESDGSSSPIKGSKHASKGKSSKNSGNNTGYDGDESELSQLSQKRGKPTTNGQLSDDEGHLRNETTLPISKDDSSHSNGGGGRNGKPDEFLSPNTVFSGSSYKRLRTSVSGSSSNGTPAHKDSNGSSSFTATSSLFSNPHCLPKFVEDAVDGTEFDHGGKRKDTPMLPRILKNPGATYELVKKSLSFEKEHKENSNSAEGINGDSEHSENDAQKHQSGGRKVSRIEEINLGDKISFKVVELDENYSPVMSAPRKAIVTGIKECHLLLKYLDAESVKKKQRSGIFELDDEDLKLQPLDDELETDRLFTDLLELVVIT